MRVPYNQAFFEAQKVGFQSSRLIVERLLKLLPVASVLDVGCGIGVWATSFREQGVIDYIGLDGKYIDLSQLQFEADRFIPHDLTVPFRLARAFDLAICLEVAEHLPGQCAGHLVESLCRHAPAVLFSAAVPGQGGVNHVNEQWPDYWIALFRENGYVAVDCIRPCIWGIEDIDTVYRQNILLFLREKHASLELLAALPSFYGASLVHPNMWTAHINAATWRLITRLFVRRIKLIMKPKKR
jgi:SAM-dependent methyltransferase